MGGSIAGRAVPARVVPELTHAERRELYATNGYLVVANALSTVEVEKLRAEATSICRGDRGPVSGAQPASARETEDEVLARYLCIHHPHKISAVMAGAIHHPAIVDVLTDVVGPNVKCMQ